MCGNRVDGQFILSAYDNMLKACSEKLKFPFNNESFKESSQDIKK